MELRELRGDDLFTVMTILGKLDVKDELVKAFESGNQISRDLKKGKRSKEDVEAEAEKRGMRVMATLLQQVMLNIGKVKGDVNMLLADLTGKSVKEIETLKLTEYTNLLIKVFKHPDIHEVFTSAVSSLMGQETGTANTK